MVTTVKASDRSARDGWARRIAPMTSSPLRGAISARAGELGCGSPDPPTALRTTEQDAALASSRIPDVRRRDFLEMTNRTDTAIIYP
jgi:hypothetical protein